MLIRLCIALALLLAASDSPAQDWQRVSPFTALEIDADSRILVRHGGRWYELASIDAIPADELLAFAEERFGNAPKRLAEDIADVLAAMGREPGPFVRLVLIDPQTGAESVHPRVEMTRAKRDKAYRYAGRLRAVDREHADVVDARYATLAEPIRGAAAEPRITRDVAEANLDTLEALLLDRHAYADLRAIDVEAAFDTLRASLPDEIARDDLAIRLAKLIALLGDGHAGIEDVRSHLAPGYLPFLVERTDAGLVAFEPDRASFVDPSHPILVAIDGVPVERWIEQASELVAHGSGQLVRRRSVRLLREVNHLRRELGLPESREITISLADASGAGTVERTVRVADARPVYADWPRTGSRMLDDAFGYIRIAEMSGDEADAAIGMLRWNADLDGLIIDVRANGGGNREALVALAGMILEPGESVVANAAVYRVHPAFGRDHLASRFLFRAGEPAWLPEQRDAIRTFTAGFLPDPAPDTERFSDWHYLALWHRDDLPRIECPVVVLMDDGCFSATDVFLAGMGQLPGVTLLGTPSSGGSGRSRSWDLPGSGLSVRLSTMMSYQPDGRLFDGVGVPPDVRVGRALTYHLIGGHDAQLEAAIELLRRGDPAP